MKRSFLISLFLSFFGTVLISQTTIWQEDFETDGNGSRYTASSEFFDGKDDYTGRVEGATHFFEGMATQIIDVIGNGTAGAQNGMYSGYTGNYFYASEDQDDDGGDGLDEKSITFNAIDISNASGLTFRGLFAAGNTNSCSANTYDNTDYIEVYYNVDGGGEMAAICFTPDIECNIPGDNTNEPLHHDPNCDGDGGEGTLMTNTLQEVVFTIPDGNSLVLRIEVHMDSGNEEIAFDDFRLEAVTVVPVELTLFEAMPKDDEVMIFWETSQEQENDFFEVQRSRDGELFETIGQVLGNGTTFNPQSYQFVDDRLPVPSSLLYYRLRQVDFDGTESFSEIRSVEISEIPTEQSVSIFPNPVTDSELTIFWNTVNSSEEILIEVLDIAGKKIYSQVVQNEMGVMTLPLATDWAAGIYFLHWTNGTQVETLRFIRE